jgi:6-phosphofructokinase 1
MEYTRDLGYCAAQFVVDGGSGAMVTLVGGHFQPMPFDDMLDPATGRTRVRLVDPDSEQYRIARAYMVRLNADDFEDAERVAAMADVAHLSPAEFIARFA